MNNMRHIYARFKDKLIHKCDILLIEDLCEKDGGHQESGVQKQKKGEGVYFNVCRKCECLFPLFQWDHEKEKEMTQNPGPLMNPEPIMDPELGGEEKKEHEKAKVRIVTIKSNPLPETLIYLSQVSEIIASNNHIAQIIGKITNKGVLRLRTLERIFCKPIPSKNTSLSTKTLLVETKV